MKILAILVTSATFPAFLGGAAEKEARAVASILRTYALEYDSKIEDKALHEQQFYDKQLQNLRDLWLPGDPTAKDKNGSQIDPDKVPETDTEKVLRSVPYLRIRTTAMRDAVALSEELEVHPMQNTVQATITDYLQKGLDQDKQAFAEAQQRQQELRDKLAASLTSLDLEDDRRKQIRDELLKLENNPTLTEQLSEAIAIGKAAQQEFKKQPEKKQPPKN